MTETGLVPIAYTFSVLNVSISLGTPGGNKSSKISGVEKHRPCASQTLVFMKLAYTKYKHCTANHRGVELYKAKGQYT